ncbi:MAG: NADH-quinone oxidoreductase subunit A [Candidatus Gastranaerophilaceae bacterium]
MENLIFLTCFIIFGFLTAVLMLVMGYIFSYKYPNKIKSSTYECGLAPKSSAKLSFNISYFYYLIMFLIFDVVSIFLYPILACSIEYSKSHYLIILIYLITVFIALIKIIREAKI